MAGMSRISALFTADTSGLSSGTRQAASSLRALSSEVAAMRSSLRALVGINAAQLFGSIASGVSSAARSFATMAGSSSETIDQLSKMAARLGVSYSDMSGLALAADLAGVSVGSLAGAMTKADRAFIEAQRGSKSAVDAFGRIGLSMDELGRLDPRQRFEAIADAIAALPTEAERSAAAIALFGKSGAELLPLFSEGANGIREAREQAERLGLTLTNVQGQNVEAMNDSWTLVKRSIEGVVQQIVANLSPAITTLNRMWTDFVQSTGGANIGVYISDALLDGAEYLAGVADYLYENLNGVWEFASRVAVQWSSVWDVGARIGAGLQIAAEGIKAAFALIVVRFTSAIEELLTSVRNVVAYIPGVDTAGIDTALSGLSAFNESLTTSISDAGNSISENWEIVWNGITTEGGEALAGPFRTAVLKGRDAMLAARGATDQPRGGAGTTTGTVRAELDTAKLADAIDARSTAGNKELLRLMYGSGNRIEEQQLAAQERAADAAEETAENLANWVPFEEMVWS